MFQGAKTTYFLVLISTLLVQASVFIVSKIDESGASTAALATYLMVSAFATSVLTLGGLNVTVDMEKRGCLAKEIGFYASILAVLSFLTCVFGVELLFPNAGGSKNESGLQALIAVYIFLSAAVVLIGSVSAVRGAPRDGSAAERVYIYGVFCFLLSVFLGVQNAQVAYASGCVACVFFIAKRVLHHSAFLAEARFHLPSRASQAVLVWNFINSVLAYSFQYADTILIGAFLSKIEFGIYFMLVQLSFIPKYLSVQLGRVVLPYAASLKSVSDEQSKKLRSGFFLFIFIVCVCTIAATIYLSSSGLLFFGEAYFLKRNVLWLLMAASIVSLPGPVLYTSLIAEGKTRLFALVNIFSGIFLIGMQGLVVYFLDSSYIFIAFAAARLTSTMLCQVLLGWFVAKADAKFG